MVFDVEQKNNLLWDFLTICKQQNFGKNLKFLIIIRLIIELEVYSCNVIYVFLLSELDAYQQCCGYSPIFIGSGSGSGPG